MTTNTLIKTTVLPVNVTRIPKQLVKANQWVGWRKGLLKPNGKYDKIPVNRHLNNCNVNLNSSWMPFDVAVLQYQRNLVDGLGFVLNGNVFISDEGKDFYLIGIDMDRCVTGNYLDGYKLSASVIDVWKQLNKPYLEISPSGTGVRMFVLSCQKIESSNFDGNEMYIDKRYLTITGHVPEGFEGGIVDATTAVVALHINWFPKKHKAKHQANIRNHIAKQVESRDGLEADIRSALSFLSSDINRDDWRDIIWSIRSSGIEDAEEIAKAWSETSPNRYTDEGFNNVWGSFDIKKGITLGTLFHHARLAGWQTNSSQMCGEDLADILNGRLFAEANRDKLLFLHETGEVLKFTHFGWVYAPPGEAERAAKAIVKDLLKKAAQSFRLDPVGVETKQQMAHASKSSFEPRVRAMISMAMPEPGMTKCLHEFDADAHLLGVLNGVLDLHTGQLREVSPHLLISMRANVNFNKDADCPNWQSFLNKVQPDKEVQRLLQQLVGLFLTGESGIQKLIILYGLGANGKSTFIEVISMLLGNYGLRVATEMLMYNHRSPQGPSPDIVSLKGKRMVYCNEVEEGRRIDEARIKELTGGDTLSGRAPYAKHSITFRPTFNLVMVGNHKPEIHDMSHGMWRRMLLIPFNVTISSEQQDEKLIEKLKEEGAGILNWALTGYRDYKKNGLCIPSSISSATDGYKAEEDLLGEWMHDHAITIPGAKALIHEAYNAYKSWAHSRGHRPLAQTRLTRRLKDRGFERDGGKRHYLGFELSIAGKSAACLSY